MASMIDGESYLGRVMIRLLSRSGDVTLYLWPLRCLNNKVGGPTFGIDIRGEEILRFDAHGPQGHWHKGGYDKLGAASSTQEFPEGVTGTAEQLSWSLAHIRRSMPALLTEAGYPDESVSLDNEMIGAATKDVLIHLEKEGDVYSQGVQQGLIKE
jgi:hypothetical protein